MKNFGTLEYVLDRYSQDWSWKITGSRAVNMISRLIPESWYGDGPNEAIIPDNTENIQQIKWILDRYPLEVLSKSAWNRKIVKSHPARQKIEKTEKLNRVKPGDLFKGSLLNFQKEGLDFLIKSSGNALLADEMGLGKCIIGTSLIETVNGQVPISELWKNSSVIERDGDEEWAKLLAPLTIQTFDGQKITAKKITRIFRQKIDEPIVKIMIWDSSVLECTRRHRLLTPDGWKRAGELTLDDRVAVPAKTLHVGKNHLTPELAELMAWQLAEGYEYFENEKYAHGRFYDSDPKVLSQTHNLATKQGMGKELACLVINKFDSTNNNDLAAELHSLATESIHWCKIKSIDTRKHTGYVYDLSVPKTHNYIVNGIITHNTVQTLAYLASETQAFPALIVAPLVTLNNWQREIGKFLKRKSRNGRILDDQVPTSTIIRKGKKADLGEYDFYIINYELLDKRFSDLSKTKIKSIVCDEVQNLRSKTTKKYAAVKKLAALPSIQHRIGLSGTPIYNRGSEIWPIVDILRPGMLGSFKEFCGYFCFINEKGKAIVLENKRESLRKELQKHVMLRRKKTDVLKELKDKVRYKEVIDADTDYYFNELNKIWRKLEEEQKDASSEFDKSASYQRAIQSERQVAGAAKLPHVINFVKNIMEIEESVVVFCHHKAIHQLLHKSLSEFSPVSVIGGQTDKARQEQIDLFQEGKSKLMIAGLRAGNVGINLTRARYVIFAELDWSPAIHRQAEDRLHRIGQKNTVFAYYLIGNGTLDDHVANVLVDKSYEIDAIMDEKAESYENKEKAQLILAQIQDRLRAK